jgi:RNA polymerase sigma-70 factor (ECF subfamily)
MGAIAYTRRVRSFETSIGGQANAFPSTMWSDILKAADASSPECRDRLDRLLRAYWRPVYAYIRHSWHRSVEDAKDLTQAFFARILEREYLASLRPEKGSFRAYLKTALRHFMINAKTVGRPPVAVIAIDAAPRELESLGAASDGDTPERVFDREWFRSLMDESIRQLGESLARDGKAAYFDAFRAYCLDERGGPRAQDGSGPTYADVAAKLGVKESDVRNYLSHARAILWEILRRRVRDYAGGDDDVERELAEASRG